MTKKAFTIKKLSDIIENKIKKHKKKDMDENSYTHMLLQKGKTYIERKLNEETLEVIIESHNNDRGKIIEELGDLFYHALVLAGTHNISLNDIEKHLASKHDSCSSHEKINKKTLSILDSFRDKSSRHKIEPIIKKYKISSLSGGDVCFISPNVRDNKLLNKASLSNFPVSAKALRTQMQSKGLKVKMAISPGHKEEFSSRRDVNLVLPSIMVLKLAALPLCINLLAGYIKDWLDKNTEDKKSKKPNIQVNIGFTDSSSSKESWYSIKGSPKEVHKALNVIANINTAKKKIIVKKRRS